MEPNVHSQKSYSLQLINQQAYRSAISAKMSLANAQLFAGAEYVQNKIGDMSIEGRINSRPAQTGQISKILLDGYWCVISFIIVSFPEDVGDQWIHFLLHVNNDGTIAVSDNCHAIINDDGSFENGDVGDFFNQ